MNTMVTKKDRPQFGIRLGDAERAYLERAALKLSEGQPTKVGLGPFLVWAAKKEAERLLGVPFEGFETPGKRVKGGGR